MAHTRINLAVPTATRVSSARRHLGLGRTSARHVSLAASPRILAPLSATNAFLACSRSADIPSLSLLNCGQDESGQQTCRNCAKGKYSTGGAAECIICVEDFIAPMEGLSECLPCDDNAKSNKDRTTCTCRAGFYLDDRNVKPDEPDGGRGASRNRSHETKHAERLNCVGCPRGAVCETEGVQWSSLLTESGW